MNKKLLCYSLKSSKKIVEELIESPLDKLPSFTSTTTTMKNANSKGLYQIWKYIKFFLLKYFLFIAFCVRIMHISSMGELGYELHLENEECVSVYRQLMEIGSQYGLKNAGFRALNSLNCEKGILFRILNSFTFLCIK